MKTLMQTKIILTPAAVASIFLLSSTTLQAQDSTVELYDANEIKQERLKTENKAILGGAIIGGIIAGPPGVFISTIVSALASSRYSTDKENKQLHASLAHNESQLVALQQQQEELEARYQLALEENQNRNFMQVNMPVNNDSISCCADSELALHFKTNSADIEVHYQQQLQELARLANKIPEPIIELTGYADRRGINQDNLRLSKQRINAVENSLISLGVERNIIQSNAFGENHPLNSIESTEGNFFDRRVNVKIRSANNDFITLSE